MSTGEWNPSCWRAEQQGKILQSSRKSATTEGSKQGPKLKWNREEKSVGDDCRTETGTVGREKLKEHEQWSEQLSGKRIHEGRELRSRGRTEEKPSAQEGWKSIFHSNLNMITTDSQMSPFSLPHLIIEIKINSQHTSTLRKYEMKLGSDKESQQL
jgi:hypothetical protein